jgi:Ti-type conjugative transfer relaxase TraA
LLFWQAADRYERVNGRPFREIEVALPRELTDTQRVELVREFVDNVLGDRHAYTWAIHAPTASDGREQPHAHIMFSERVNDGIERDPEQFFRRWNAKDPERGGAGKDRYLSHRAFVSDVRTEWAMTANQFLERNGIDARIDERSYRDQGIELEPQLKRGISAHAVRRGVLAEISTENRDRAARNGERLIANPEVAIQALVANQSVFSRRDLERLVFRNSDNVAQFQNVMLRVLRSPELVPLSEPGTDRERFTSRELHDIEQRLVAFAGDLAQRTGVTISEDARALGAAGKQFNDGQRAAYDLLTGAAALATVNGAAGTGKSYVLASMREAYAADGFRVIGAALQGKTADDLQRDAGIESSTLHRLLGQLGRGELSLDSRTVLVVDEAGLVGSRQMEQLLAHVERGQSRVRLIGDAWQLHAIDAGDAFRRVSLQADAAHSNAELTEILRQREDWQRAASTSLSRHAIAEGLAAYQTRGFVHEFAEPGDARAALLGLWRADRRADPSRTQLLLAHTNDERQALNRAVRQIRQDGGELGTETVVQTSSRRLAVADGERLLFLKNDTGLGVKNGSLGTVEHIDGDRLSVTLDGGRKIKVDARDYGDLDYGYALTVHKAQGVTVDRAYLLATSSLNAQLAYVSMTRHRDQLQIAYSREHFSDAATLASTLAQAEVKTFSADYLPGERRQHIETGDRTTLAQRQAAVRAKSTSREPTPPERPSLRSTEARSPAMERLDGKRSAALERSGEPSLDALQVATQARAARESVERVSNHEDEHQLQRDRSRGLER